MNINEIIKLIKEGKVKRLSDRSWQVGDHHVSETIRPGRTFRDCDCEQAGKFGNTTICKHKDSIIIFEFLRYIKNEK